jgi:hypothetical protein
MPRPIYHYRDFPELFWDAEPDAVIELAKNSRSLAAPGAGLTGGVARSRCSSPTPMWSPSFTVASCGSSGTPSVRTATSISDSKVAPAARRYPAVRSGTDPALCLAAAGGGAGANAHGIPVPATTPQACERRRYSSNRRALCRRKRRDRARPTGRLTFRGPTDGAMVPSAAAPTRRRSRRCIRRPAERRCCSSR